MPEIPEEVVRAAEEAARSVPLRLGPNAVQAMAEGRPVRLSGSEAEEVARAVLEAIAPLAAVPADEQHLPQSALNLSTPDEPMILNVPDGWQVEGHPHIRHLTAGRSMVVFDDSEGGTVNAHSLAVPCPYCDAPPGELCWAADGVRDVPHLVRRRAAQRGLERCGRCGTIGWLAAGTVPPEPLTVGCPACLALPGEQCVATSTDEPRYHPHKFRALTAAESLRRCPDCDGRGWRQASGKAG